MFYCTVLEHECPEGITLDCKDCPIVKGPDENQIIKTTMSNEKFQEFSVHEYMDEYPRQEVRVMTKEQAVEFADHMNKNYSGGTTKYVGEMNYAQAFEHTVKMVRNELTNTQDDSLDFITNICEKFIKCYK